MPAPGVNSNPRCIEEARRSTWIVWPPMPAPPVIATATRAGSEDSAVCVCFQVVAALRSAAAVLSADSLEATSLSAVCWAVTALWR